MDKKCWKCSIERQYTWSKEFIYYVVKLQSNGLFFIIRDWIHVRRKDFNILCKKHKVKQ